MKFVQLHSTVGNSPFYINMENVEKMEWTSPTTQTTQNASTVIETNYEGYTKIRMMNKEVYYCKETTIEILLKIAEADKIEDDDYFSEIMDWKG